MLAGLCGVLSSAPLARAHGIVPRAATPLSQDATGIALVQLTRGLALRAEAGFRYYCPAGWDGSENAPAAFLPGGPAVVALQSGLVLVAADGTATPYPERNLGSTVALASASSGAYALSLKDARYELRRLASDHSELLWSDAQTEGKWNALAASEQTLVLFRLGVDRLSQLLLSTSGVAQDKTSAAVPSDTVSLTPQLIGATPYAIVQSDSGDRIELGRIAQGQWVSLARATGNLGGPILTTDGALMVAVDGVLSLLSDDKLGAALESEFVTGLASFDGHGYAAVRSGLRALTGTQLGAQVFDFGTLAGPLYTGLTPPERTSCLASWQHLQVDLVAAGLVRLDAPDAGLDDDAGVLALDAGSKLADAQVGAHLSPDASPDAASVPVAAGAHDSGGCAVSAGHVSSTSRTQDAAFLCTLLLTLAGRLRISRTRARRESAQAT